jgi:exonuclease SbcC
MKLLKLEVRNFKPFRELSLPEGDIDLPSGLIIVKGPNSTGKSSLFEAILWGLWGADAVGLTNDELISFSSTFCSVILIFEVAGAKYKIDRSYNPADGMSVVLFMKTESAWKRIADKSKSVATKIDEILSLELRQALNTLLVRQGEVAAIANATPSVLRNLLVEVYDIDILNRMSNHLDNFETNLESKISGLMADYRSPEDLQEQIKQCNARIKQYNESIKSRNEEISSTEKLLKNIPDSTSLKKVSEITLKLEREQRDFELRKKELENDLEQAGLLDADESIVHARLDSLHRERERVESEREELLADMQKIDQEIGQIQGINSDLNEKIATLTRIKSDDEKAICPTCSKPLSPKERDNLVSDYRKSIKISTSKIKGLEQHRIQDSSNLKKMDLRLREISRISDSADKVQKSKKQVDDVQQEIKESEKELKEILDDVGLRSVAALLKRFNVDSLSDLQMKVAKLESTLNASQRGISEIEENIQREEVSISEVEGKEVLMKQMGAEIQEMKSLNEHAKYVRRKLVSGFVADYVFQKRLLGIIRSATNQYVRFFTSGQYTSIDLVPTPSTKRSGPGLLLKIWDERDQAWKKPNQLSYGDRTAISLGLRLGISRTMSSIRPLRDSPVITPRVKSVLLDEPLGGLDKVRREAVLSNLINDKNFEQILLITHTDVQGWEGVPIIEVAKANFGSTATLEM